MFLVPTVCDECIPVLCLPCVMLGQCYHCAQVDDKMGKKHHTNYAKGNKKKTAILAKKRADAKVLCLPSFRTTYLGSNSRN